MKLTFEQLKQIVPTLSQKAEVFIPYLNEAIEEYQINTPRRLAGFIAQCAHESGGFKYTTEIASGAAYQGRKDLGNIYPNDGIKFKGRGILQITGRSNYEQVSKVFGVDFVKSPELLAAPQYAVKTSAWKFVQIKGNNLMDLPDTWRSETKKYCPFEYLTYRVNGGQNGAAERLEYFNRALTVFNK